MKTIDARSGLERLTREQCVALLETQEVGRLVAVDKGRPLIFPVNYALDGEAVVFRTSPGLKLWASTTAPVAFEVDELDRTGQTGWSVIVQGVAQEVTAFDRSDVQARVYGLPVHPWAGGDKSTFVRIAPRFITGRRICH
ncbi:MAG: hypothetical protein JWP02_1861 [Acidimicrobiales bacterium]|nr:hypothetical protein [Acidimicrobiales bacterium]